MTLSERHRLFDNVRLEVEPKGSRAGPDAKESGGMADEYIRFWRRGSRPTLHPHSGSSSYSCCFALIGQTEPERRSRGSVLVFWSCLPTALVLLPPASGCSVVGGEEIYICLPSSANQKLRFQAPW